MGFSILEPGQHFSEARFKPINIDIIYSTLIERSASLSICEIYPLTFGGLKEEFR
jgi:hypothetical protein